VQREWLVEWFRGEIESGALPARYSQAAMQAVSAEFPRLAGLSEAAAARRFVTQDLVNIRNSIKGLPPKGESRAMYLSMLAGWSGLGRR
jgi:hypothetical protein